MAACGLRVSAHRCPRFRLHGVWCGRYCPLPCSERAFGRLGIASVCKPSSPSSLALSWWVGPEEECLLAARILVSCFGGSQVDVGGGLRRYIRRDFPWRFPFRVCSSRPVSQEERSVGDTVFETGRNPHLWHCVRDGRRVDLSV